MVARPDASGFWVSGFAPLTFGGEGCFNTELQGPGVVYMQSVTYESLARTLVKKLESGGEQKQGKGNGNSDVSL